MTEASPAVRASTRAEPARGLAASTTSALASRPRGGPAWLEARRAEAAARFEATGLPSVTDEAFRFTSLGRVLRVPFAAGAVGERLVSPFDGLTARRIHVDNGRIASDAFGTADGIDVRTLGDVLASDPGLLEPYLAKLAASDNGFVAQNTALFQDGVVIVARRKAKSGIVHLAYSGSGASPALGTPRVLVVAEPESELFLLESHVGQGEFLESSVTEVFVGQGATVEHVRVELGTEHSSALSTTAVRQSRDSRYRSRVLSFGGKTTRVDLRIELAEQGAECALDGVFLATAGTLLDHHTLVVHASPRCTSRERYKGIADGDGIAVFDGTVVVRSGASGTEAHQENRNLLLSNDAVIHAKPHLEIDTDDVKCSHGATVGRLDPAQLFYLRSRGIDAEVARSLLTYAFAREVVGTVSRSDVRDVLEDIVATRLPSGAAARELA
ncbi:MAG TPA: Fe-S cluster assembly protein SufD [Polyangiaceae bacterium]|jgi:Fe-S cluster assembly protein SufD|nr:Fe-S cluster assembly protein SufD [Polyangiaceae bacterium]